MILRTVQSNFNRLQIKPLLCRSVSIYKTKCCSDKVTVQAPDWETIFKFPAIKWVAAFNRLKFYQLGFTGFCVPVCFALESANFASSGLGLISFSIGVTGFITLGFCNYFSKNVIGFVYMNKQGDKVKLAYTDYWGRRQHVEVPVESVMPFKETPNKFNFYQKVVITDSKDSYKLIQKYGVMSDAERFTSVFGE